MKCLIDKKSVYDFRIEYLKEDENIYYQLPDNNQYEVIGTITSITEIDNDYVDIRYKITNEKYQYNQGKNVNIHLTEMKNQYGNTIHVFIAEVTERKKRAKRKVNYDTTITIRTNSEVWENFKIICEVMGTNPSRIINKTITDYVNENYKIVKNNLTNKIINNKINDEGGNEDGQ